MITIWIFGQNNKFPHARMGENFLGVQPESKFDFVPVVIAGFCEAQVPVEFQGGGILLVAGQHHLAGIPKGLPGDVR